MGKEYGIEWKEDGISKRTASSFSAFFNIVCAVAGAGALGLPYSLRDGGWISLAFFLLAAVLSTFTAKQLIECLYYKEGERLEEMADIGEAAFGMFGRYFVKVFNYSISLSFACIFILLSGHNAYNIVNEAMGYVVIQEAYWTVLAGFIILVPFALLKTLKEVSFLALFGVLTTVVVVFIVIIVGGIDYASSTTSVETTLLRVEGIPLALSTIAYCYGGNVVYPHVEATMRHPESWNKVMVYATICITVIFVSAGGAGYLYFGDEVQSPVLDSLPRGLATTMGYILITVHVILAAPIYLCSFALDQERWLNIDTMHLTVTSEFVKRLILRTSIVGVLTLIAVYIPYFSDLVSLVGAVSNCIIIFLVPTVCHYKLFGYRNRKMHDYLLSALVILIALIGLTFGSYSAMTNLILHIKTGQAAAPKAH
ncbi:hypothetical protein DSO57_1038535 [Entomophthora muscae]|uniref:Uncharacterized protein n=1 Tax=Entomophthora muscae TaxID=34485 RepID=A0ACC2SYZ4_9FUNG|nr:hypothetical protein DSO57_1038535 [Entomophthora muscae]